MKKSLKIVLIIIFIIFILFIINLFRNVTILNCIQKKLEKTSKITTFSFLVKNNGELMVKCYRNKDVFKMEMYDKKQIRYFNNETGKYIVTDMNTKEEKDISNLGGSVYISIPEFHIENVLKTSLKNIITTNNCNGKECYKLKIDSETYFIDKESGVIVKVKDKNTICEYEYNFDNIDI